MASTDAGIREFVEDAGDGTSFRYESPAQLVEWSGSNRRLLVPSGAFGRSAASVAAQLLARREFGKSGRVGALRQDMYREDGSAYSYEAFIGRPATGGGTSGHNVRFTIYP